MEEWHDKVGLVGLGQLVCGDDVLDGCHQVCMAEGNTLGAAGGATGMQEESNILRVGGLVQWGPCWRPVRLEPQLLGS